MFQRQAAVFLYAVSPVHMGAGSAVGVIEADDLQLETLLGKLRRVIDEAVDDLRAYHLPESCAVWSLGSQHWPDGICLSGTHAARLLHAATASQEEARCTPEEVLRTST